MRPYRDPLSPTVTCSICGVVVPRRSKLQRCCQRPGCRREHARRVCREGKQRKKAEGKDNP